MTFLYRITIILILILFVEDSYAQEYRKLAYHINTSFGQFTPHKKSMNYLVEGKSPGIEISLEDKTNDSIRYGITLSFLNSGNKKVIGNIYGFNGFSSFPLSKNKNSMRFVIGVGIAYIDNIFDANNNNQNIAIGSHINSKIVFKTEKSFILSDNDNLNLGFGICHFSNGSYQTPNLGLNFLLLNLGYSRNQYSKKPIVEKKTNSNLLNKKWAYNLVLTSGIRENIHPLRNKYPLINISNRINYLRTNKNHFAAGIDISYNPAILHTSDTALTISPFHSGVFIGNELNYGKIAFTIDMGIYTFHQNLRSRFYHRFGINYLLNERFSLLFLLKSHWAVAETFAFGIKYRVK